MAYASRKRNFFSESINFYELSIEHAVTDDSRAKLMKNLGAVLHYVNEFEAAISVYEKALKMDTRWVPNLAYNEAIAYHSLGDFIHAADALDLGLKYCRDHDNAYYAAKLWNVYGDMETEVYKITRDETHKKLAYQYFGYALEQEDNKVEHARAHKYIGELLLVQGDTSAASDYLYQGMVAQEHKQYKFHATMSYAQLCYDRGISKEARVYVDSALLLYPEITRAKEELKVFFLAGKFGYDVLEMLEEQFDIYSRELVESAQVAYRSYVGRQIKKQEALREQKRQLLWGLAALVVLAGGLGWTIYIKRRAVRIQLRKIQGS